MIDIPDQPLARMVLAGALAHGRVPQQFLFSGPAGTGKRRAAAAVARHLIGIDPAADPGRASLDLSVVRASGAQILVEDLEDALRDLATRPVVGRCRVAIVEGAERLRDVAGNRILKPLEEPPPGSHVILVTDRPEDLLPTIRSRCVPVPFRTPGWRTVAGHLRDRGVDAELAESMARAEGPMALAGDGFHRSMREVGMQMGLGILEGGRSGRRMVDEAQARMEAAAADHPSPELVELRRAAAELEGKRGGKTAAKRADDQQKRERRRMINDGWEAVMGGAAAVVADGLAVAVGSPGTVRHRHLTDRITRAAAPAAFCERAIAELEATRADLQLNPTVDVAVQTMLVRIEMARHGERVPLVHPGRLPW
ncbi:MAG: hypothetical protein U0Y82_01045 [Thermoleophilia bacterium]